MSWQLYFHHSLRMLLKSCSLQSLGAILGDTPPQPAQELLLINIPLQKQEPTSSAKQDHFHAKRTEAALSFPLPGLCTWWVKPAPWLHWGKWLCWVGKSCLPELPCSGTDSAAGRCPRPGVALRITESFRLAIPSRSLSPTIIHAH